MSRGICEGRRGFKDCRRGFKDCRRGFCDGRRGFCDGRRGFCDGRRGFWVGRGVKIVPVGVGEGVLVRVRGVGLLGLFFGVLVELCSTVWVAVAVG